MPEDGTPKYMAKIVVVKLDRGQDRVETTVKATTLEKLQQKVTVIMGTMEEGVDL